MDKQATQKVLKTISNNILIAIGLMLYFVILNMAYTSIEHEKLAVDIKVFSAMYLIVGLIIIEKAYKKDKGILAITGIEFLVISFHSLLIVNITTLFQYNFKYYLLMSSYIFAIYYVLKSIIIYTKEKRKYLKSFNDISEIVKDDEPIKKEAKKRNNDE